MSYMPDIVKLIEDKELEEIGSGLDELLIHHEGRAIANYLLVNHPKTRIYCPSVWRSFKPAVIRYVRQQNMSKRELKKLADELGIMYRTLKNAVEEIE